MAKKFYVCILRGTCDPEASTVEEFESSEQVQAYLLEQGETDPEYVWIIHGERFGFKTIDKPVAFMLTGPTP